MEDASSVSSIPFFAAIRENKSIESYHYIRSEIGPNGLMVPLNAPEESEQPVHEISPEKIDWDVLSSWLSNCDADHVVCRQAPGTSIALAYLRVIDCVQGIIVEKFDLSEKYLTLSYVWGTHRLQPSDENLQELDSDGSSPVLRNAPLTIRDAITAVKCLGYRYIWIDKYCIRQGDTVEKALTIQNMDIIYENSDATLVAVHGDSEKAGFPGVSSTQREHQLSFSHQGRRFISTLPSITGAMKESVWNTRGWTYQEARLSRRCLFFTRFQVYFVCRHETLSEAIRVNSKSSSLAKGFNSMRLAPSLFSMEDSYLLKDSIFRDRLVFSQRILTYNLDALNAFRGILSRSEWITFWGVSIIPRHSDMDPCVGFALGMLWMARPPWSLSRHIKGHANLAYVRRSGFPIWSWTSVIGEIYDDT